MDCCICSPCRRNVICAACLEGAKELMTFVCTNLQQEPTYVNNKGLANALKLVKEMKMREEFLEGFSVAFRDGIHTDIQLKPGNNGDCIPTHRVLLATRSDIFKNMLDSDVCKASSINETISFPEMNHDELHSFLEFLYSGRLPSQKVKDQVYTLYTAADKFKIPFLQKFCEHWILDSLDSSNVLDVLEMSDVYSNTIIKDAAMNFIVKHIQDIVFSDGYDAFGLKNPHLNVQIMKKFISLSYDHKELVWDKIRKTGSGSRIDSDSDSD